MKFISESLNHGPLELFTEATSDGKTYFIEGIFAQADVVNGNGRLYPREVLEEQISSYVKHFVSEGRAIGELDHPSTPRINLDRASHLVTDLYMNGSDVIGKAKLLNTPHGQIAKTLLEDGVRIGVSTRGLAAMESKGGVEHVRQFRLAAIDIVGQPSAPKALVNHIAESLEWSEDGEIIDVGESRRLFVLETLRKLGADPRLIEELKLPGWRGRARKKIGAEKAKEKTAISRLAQHNPHALFNYTDQKGKKSTKRRELIQKMGIKKPDKIHR